MSRTFAVTHGSPTRDSFCHLGSHGRHGKEIQGDDIFDIVVQKCLPDWRGRLLGTDPVLFHSRFGHVNAELPQLSDDAGGGPQGVGPRHVANQGPDFLGNSGSSKLATLAQAPPVVTKSLRLSGDHHLGLDERQSCVPARPESREECPEQAISRVATRAMEPSVDRPQPDAARRGFPGGAMRESGTARR